MLRWFHALATRRRLGVLAGAVLSVTLATFGEGSRFDKAPEFPSKDAKHWIGPPQSLKSLLGKVVILDVWTFG